MCTFNLRSLLALSVPLTLAMAASLTGCASMGQTAPAEGSRLTLQVDFDRATPTGPNAKADDPSHSELLKRTAETLRDRLDSFDLLEPKITVQGDDRIVVELPGYATQGGQEVSSLLTEGLAKSATVLNNLENEEGFPPLGGLVRIDSEDIHYSWQTGGDLTGLVRGARGTTATHHNPGATVQLVSDDSIKTALERKGQLAFVINATASDFIGSGSDPVNERNKLKAWVAANPSAPLLAFNSIPESAGGPNQLIKWCVERPDPAAPSSELDRAVLVLRQGALGHPKWVFDGESLAAVYASSDELGRPAIGFKIKEPRRDDFTAFTEAHLGRLLSVELDGMVISTATIKGVLPGSGQIYGKFTPQYIRSMVALLETKPLEVQVKVIGDERDSAPAANH